MEMQETWARKMTTTCSLGDHRGSPVTPKVPGRINGGFFPRKSDWPDQYPSVVIAVDDLKKSMAQVASAGGSVLNVR